MKYTKIKQVTYYQTLFKGNYTFCISCNEKAFYAMVMHNDEMLMEKAMSVAVAKQILLNHLYRLIHGDAQADKDKTFILEQVKKCKTEDIVNFVY